MQRLSLAVISVIALAMSATASAQQLINPADPARYSLTDRTPRPFPADEDFVRAIGTDENPIIARPGSDTARMEVDGYIDACLSTALRLEDKAGICENAMRYDRSVQSVAGETWYGGARAYLAVGDVRRARDAYEVGIRHWNMERDPGELNYIEGTRVTPAYLADAHCEFARFLWRDNQISRAHDEFTRAQQYAPQIACATAGLAALARNEASPEGPMPAQRNFTSPPGAINIIQLAAQCSAEREDAIEALFGNDATRDEGLLMDQGLARSSLGANTIQGVVASYHTMSNVTGGNTAANAYALCLHGKRLQQLDPNIDLEAAARGEYTPPDGNRFANLPRRQAGAGAAMLQQSADPNQRNALADLRQDQIQQRDANIAQANANNAALWQGILDLAIAGLTIAADSQQGQPSSSSSQQPSDYRPECATSGGNGTWACTAQ